jgi:hypothetical protein
MNRSTILFLLLGLAAPSAAAEVKSVNLPFNTAADEDDPHLSSDGFSLYYTLCAKGRCEVMVSTRRTFVARAWSKGVPVPDINTKADTRGVFLTPEGSYPQRLYFASNRSPENADAKGDNFDLYFVTRQGKKAAFTSEEGLPFCTKDDELHPWVTREGHLYFSRKVEGRWRVFVARRPKGGGQFQEPALLKELPADFHHATLTPDGKTMYLQGPLGEGGKPRRWGLFRSVLGRGGWGKPEPLTGLNSPDAPTGDLSPCLSRNGTSLYFASDRPGGHGGLDIWYVEVNELKR